ncbi:hypothetical protein C9374_005240 [Naegleria lovaniensis]|uniref:Uncharacterized protein n=1 Tax=Naegleria lovaniensis TaxID=51637 RepID=A0AA88GLY1_NAELO|nr:uncharacterized protein C9374_005240 [Naegleria lovaniensis]KAG2382660.1 hypothetical protein C9374_005240 [Naegleria lovaniensis]
MLPQRSSFPIKSQAMKESNNNTTATLFPNTHNTDSMTVMTGNGNNVQPTTITNNNTISRNSMLPADHPFHNQQQVDINPRLTSTQPPPTQHYPLLFSSISNQSAPMSNMIQPPPSLISNMVNNSFPNSTPMNISSLLPFAISPPPTRFFSMLVSSNSSNNQQQASVQPISSSTTTGGNSNIQNNLQPSSPQHYLSNNTTLFSTSTTTTLPVQQAVPNAIVDRGQPNVFIPSVHTVATGTGQGSNVTSSQALQTTSSGTSQSMHTDDEKEETNPESNTTSNRPPLDAPAAVLLLEPPSLSTIIDDHHPTIPTSLYYIRKSQNTERFNRPQQRSSSSSCLEDIDDESGSVATLVQQNKLSRQHKHNLWKNDHDCDHICGCVEDKMEAELRLQDNFETNYFHSKKRSAAHNKYDGESMNPHYTDEDEESSHFECIENASNLISCSDIDHLNQQRKKRKKTPQENLLTGLSNLLQNLEPDCVLYIFQFLNCTGRDNWFCNIRNMYGRFKKNNQILPLYRFITIEQHSTLKLGFGALKNHQSMDCNIQSLSIHRKTNQPLECEMGYMSKVGRSLKTFIYYNHCGNNPTYPAYTLQGGNVINIDASSCVDTGSNNTTNPNGKSACSFNDAMSSSSEDELEESSFELIEDENSHVIGLKRKSRSEGSCFLKEIYRNCKVLEKLKIVDMEGYVPIKVSLRLPANPKGASPSLAFSNTLRKIRLFNCVLPSHAMSVICKMSQLESVHFEKTFVSDVNEYDSLLSLTKLKVLKLQVAQLPKKLLKNMPITFTSLEKLFLNVSQKTDSYDEKFNVELLTNLRSLSVISHFNLDLLALMRNCTRIEFLQLGFDVCFNHIFPNEKLKCCILRNVFISPDRSKVLIQNNTLRCLKLSPASIRAAQREIAYITQQRALLNKSPLCITEF